MEIRKVDLSKVFSRYKEEEIPTNWYISARDTYSLFAWTLNEWSKGSKLRDNKTASKMLYELWEYIEETAFAHGEEHEDGIKEGNS